MHQDVVGLDVAVHVPLPDMHVIEGTEDIACNAKGVGQGEPVVVEQGVPYAAPLVPGHDERDLVVEIRVELSISDWSDVGMVQFLEQSWLAECHRAGGDSDGLLDALGCQYIVPTAVYQRLATWNGLQLYVGVSGRLTVGALLTSTARATSAANPLPVVQYLPTDSPTPASTCESSFPVFGSIRRDRTVARAIKSTGTSSELLPPAQASR